MKVCSNLMPYFYFLSVIVAASARTCQERLDVLEDVVQSLIKSQHSRLADNDDPNQRSEEAFRIHKLEKERHGLEERLGDLEKSLAKANSRIQELETRVSEFESFEMLKNARPPTDNSKKIKLHTGLSKTKYSWPGNIDPVKQRNFVQNITDQLQNNFSMAEGQLVKFYENLRTSKGKRLLTGIQPTTTPSIGSAAFSAYVSIYETDISKDRMVNFDTIVTIIENHYNQHSGIFTAPEHVYVFSWNIYSSTGGYIFSQLGVSSNVAGAMFTGAKGAGNIRTTIGVVVFKSCGGCSMCIQSTTIQSTGGAAFSAYVSVHETDISKGYTIKFDTIVTNIGSHYNQHSGIFTAQEPGVYVFSWNIYCHSGGFIYSQLVVNSNVAGAMFTSSEGALDARSSTGVVVFQVNAGDVVYVRVNPTQNHLYNLMSHQDYRSSFSGWKLF